MRKKILIVLSVLAAILVVFAGVVAMQPDEFHVERTATIAATPAAIFAQVHDFHHWEAWSPWQKIDPEARNSFEGPPAGKGAIFKWSGNNEIGEGSMTVTECRPHEWIKIRLDFVKPFEDTSDVEFTFKPQESQTLVTWSMHGRSNFVGKAICLFMNMDRMIGDKYEEGLANLKAVVEGATK